MLADGGFSTATRAPNTRAVREEALGKHKQPRILIKAERKQP